MRNKLKNAPPMNSHGFTLIELLMVIGVIAILAVVGVTQFTSFGKDAREAALKSNLQIIRNGIATQNGIMQLRCNFLASSWPPLVNLVANDITSAGAPCTTGQVPVVSDRAFVNNGIPANPWTNKLAATAGLSIAIDQCDAGCLGALPTRTAPCVAAKTRTFATATGWCYDAASGGFWANSAGNDGLASTTGNEYTY